MYIHVGMYVYVYIHLHICTYMFVCTCIHIYVYICIIYIHMYTYTYIYAYIHICMYTYIYTCRSYIHIHIQQINICLYIYMYICTQICICICIYIHMYLYISIRMYIYTLYVYISISSILPTWSWCPGTRSFSYHLGVVFGCVRQPHLLLTAASDLLGMCSVKVFASDCQGTVLPRYRSTMIRKIWSCLSGQACETRVPDFSTLHSRPPTPPVPGYPRVLSPESWCISTSVCVTCEGACVCTASSITHYLHIHSVRHKYQICLCLTLRKSDVSGV